MEEIHGLAGASFSGTTATAGERLGFQNTHNFLPTSMSRPTSLKGFTLIELLIVIVIIGILSAGAVALFNGAQAKARDASRQSNVKTMETALQLYAADHDGAVATPANPKTLNSNYDTTVTTNDQGLVGRYMQKAVRGARSGERYCYYTNDADPSQYVVATWLEGANALYTVGNAITFSTAPTAANFASGGTCPAAPTGYTDVSPVE